MSSGDLLCHITAARVHQHPSRARRQHVFLFTLQLAWRFPSPNLLAFSCCLASSSRLYIFEYKEECFLLPSNPAHLIFFLPKPLFSHSCEKKKNTREKQLTGRTIFPGLGFGSIAQPMQQGRRQLAVSCGQQSGNRGQADTKEAATIQPSSTGTHVLQFGSTSERPYSLPKQCHKLGTKCSNMEPIREYFTLNPTPPLQLVFFGLVHQTHRVFVFVLFGLLPFFPPSHTTGP